MPTYTLPDGTTTTSLRDHVRAWRALGEPIARADGSELVAWDPDLIFALPDGTTYDLSVAAARRRRPGNGGAREGTGGPRQGAGRKPSPIRREPLTARVLPATRRRITAREAARILDEHAGRLDTD